MWTKLLNTQKTVVEQETNSEASVCEKQAWMTTVSKEKTYPKLAGSDTGRRSTYR